MPSGSGPVLFAQRALAMCGARRGVADTGMSQRELARTLQLSPGTVNHHLRSLGSGVVVSRSPVRIDSDALERITGAEPAPTPPPFVTRSSTRSGRAGPSPVVAGDLRSAAALARELCDTLTHAATLADQLAQMGFDLPGVARSERATVRDESRDGVRNDDRAPSRSTPHVDDSKLGCDTPANARDFPADSSDEGARWPRDEVRNIAQSLAHQSSTQGDAVSPGQAPLSGSEAVREPRDAARGSSSEERKKDLLSFSSSKTATESRDGERATRTAVSSRDEVRQALAPLIEQCRRCSKPYSIDDNGISILQAVPIEGLEHAVAQLCRQIRTDPQNKVRSPIGLLVSKAYHGDEIFTITEPDPPAPPPRAAPDVDDRIDDGIAFSDLWSQLNDDQRAAIDHQVKNGKFKAGGMMALGQKRALAAELLGIDLGESSAA